MKLTSQAYEVNILFRAILVGSAERAGISWRKRSIPTHSGWLYPLTFDAEKGLKEA